MDTGDEFYLMEDRKLLCKPDYEAAKMKGERNEFVGKRRKGVVERRRKYKVNITVGQSTFIYAANMASTYVLWYRRATKHWQVRDLGL